jgi:hypothetical protein
MYIPRTVFFLASVLKSHYSVRIEGDVTIKNYMGCYKG